MPSLEVNLKNAVLRKLKKVYPDMFVFKPNDKFTSGIPDLIMCYKGKFLAIELKVGSNKVTPLQQQVLATIAFAGGNVAICRSVNEVEMFLSNIFRYKGR